MLDERTSSILGRDEERGRIEQFLAGPRPAMLLVEGLAGIGKTTVWRMGIEAAKRSGLLVIAFRAAEAERSLTFGGLAGLFTDRLLDEVLSGIPEPRRRALEAALLREDPGGRTVETGVVGLAVLSVLSALAERSPVVVGIDDLQWLDDATSNVVEFALRRLDSAEVLLLAAHRTGEGGSAPRLELALPEELRTRVILGPLSVGAIGRLVHQRLGVRLPRPVAGRLHEESGGNPFIALELARAASARGALPGPGQPFPVPTDALSLVGNRIGSLSRGAQETLLAISALARPNDAILRRAAGDVADRSLRELIDSQLVQADGPQVRCAHPLIASAVYARALPSARRGLHRRLAELVDDVEERARHLALGTDGPDEAVATALDEAAAVARRRGASGAAAELAELAVTLTPPSDPVSTARRDMGLANYRLDAGSPTDALRAAADALERLPSGPQRVDPLILKGRIEVEYLGDWAAARRSFELALQEGEQDRTALARAHIAAGHWGVDAFTGGPGEIEAIHAQAALDLLAGREHEDPGSVASAMLMQVEAGFREGRGFDSTMLERAVALEDRTDLDMLERPSTQGAIGRGIAGEHRASIRSLEALEAHARSENDWSAQVILLRSLAWMWWCVGSLPRAEQVVGRALELAEEIGLDEGVTWGMGAQIHAGLGDEAKARAWATRAVSSAGEIASWWWELRGRAAVLFLELTFGNDEAAGEEAIALRDLAARAGKDYEPGWNRIHGDVIEGLLSTHRPDEAESMTRWMEQRAALSGHPWSVMVAARSRGLLEASAGRAQEALGHFERSLAADVTNEMSLERGRTLLAMGRVLRAANRRRLARETLTEARAVFESCGSGPWARRAAAELAGVSGRVASPTELTGTERRVAELAAEGKSNREVAEELFVSARTVESHLSSAFRKLGIRSRAGLAAALARHDSG